MSKNRIRVLSLLFVPLFLLCGCSPTAFLSDESRANFLFARAEEHMDPDRYHYSYEVTLDIRESGYEYSQKVAFEEMYDGSDANAEKFLYRESLNEITGLPQEYAYLGNEMYISSDSQKISAPVENLDELFAYLPYYGVYYDTGVFATLICPEPEDDVYVVTQIFDQQKVFEQAYEYLWWAIPGYLYDYMEVESLKDVYTFNGDGRLEKYEVFVEVGSTDVHSDDWVSIKYVQNFLYDEFTVELPEDVESYTHIENYAALDDMIYAVNGLIAERGGQLDVVFDYRLSGAMETEYLDSSSVTYRVDQNGILTYSMTSVFSYGEAEDSEDTVVYEYDGTTVTSESQGSRTETPVSQSEAYAMLNQQKDFLWLDRSMVADVLSVRKTATGTEMHILPTQLFTEELMLGELSYLELYADDNAIRVDSVELTLNINADGVLDSVCFTASVGFDIDGEEVILDYVHRMNVRKHN
ncbi:MAG: hypothetical protein IJY39_11220 [Clostridia bacterium]|nr:hypothetical protein [Clostridia bacterium]